jgi:hypothetical protein
VAKSTENGWSPSTSSSAFSNDLPSTLSVAGQGTTSSTCSPARSRASADAVLNVEPGRVAAGERAVDAGAVGAGVRDGEDVPGAGLHHDQRGGLALGRGREGGVGGGLHSRVERQLQRPARHRWGGRQRPHHLPAPSTTSTSRPGVPPSCSS